MENKKKYINEAVESFKKLLTEQLAREAEMKKGAKAVDFKTKEKITIGLIDGDGIGPIIMKEAKELVAFILADEVASGRIVLKEIKGLTIENRMAVGKSVPDDILAEIKACDILLKGPTETPKGGTMESANVTLRRELDLFANIRPVSIPEEGIDWTFYRENTEGEYVLGSRGVEVPGELAMDFKVTTYSGTKRIARAAFEFAKANGKDNVCIVTKANIMKKTDGNFSKICHEVAEEYPGIAADDYYIDIMTANLVNPDMRKRFSVFVLPNLYGDIITDEAAQIQGGVGSAGSANVGDKYGMFEALHGSAPRMIAEGLTDFVNPASIFRATEMMLRHIGYSAKADVLAKVLDDTKALQPTGTREGNTCANFCESVKAAIKNAM
ncbi:MAG: isocitrate/isopropylmalate family dehydrogenase [Clostridia bacterium]|nr:isocitrate/isopropylmalate family dehydrogenase [Clostridia bacterium]